MQLNSKRAHGVSTQGERQYQSNRKECGVWGGLSEQVTLKHCLVRVSMFMTRAVT